MARLPKPGEDKGAWGDVLNEYLLVSHRTDGTIQDGTVTESMIVDGAVTAPKLANSAVTSDKIALGSVIQAKIANGAITEPKLNVVNAPTKDYVLGWNSTGLEWMPQQTASGGTAASGVPSGTVVVASSTAPQEVKDAADYVCDGNADEVEINQAIASLSTDDVSTKGDSGGTVLLWGRTFNVKGPIKIRSQVTVRGLGQWSTYVTPDSSYVPGERGGVFELYSQNTQYTSLLDLAISGNGYSANCCGVYYLQGPDKTTGSTAQWDASHRIRNLYISQTAWHGLYLTYTAGAGGNVRNRALYLSNIRVIDAGVNRNKNANGLWLDSADSFIDGFDTGSSASHGIRITGGNNRFVNSKSWFSGSMAAAAREGAGFYIGANRNEFVGCEAQDNYGDGFYITGAGGFSTLAGCLADSNGYNRQAGVWTGSGFYVAAWANIQGTAIDKNENSRGLFQQYAVQFSGSPKVIVNVLVGNSAVAASAGGTASGSVVNVV